MPLPSSPFVNTGAYPTRSGNQVWLWIDGEPAFRCICAAIEAAQQSVWATITIPIPSQTSSLVRCPRTGTPRNRKLLQIQVHPMRLVHLGGNNHTILR